MAQCPFRELQARSSKVIASTPQLHQELVRQRLLTEGAVDAMVQGTGAPGAAVDPSQKAHTVIRELQTLVQTPDLLLRFHALKPLQKLQDWENATVVPWKMTIGHREAASITLHRHRKLLCHSG